MNRWRQAGIIASGMCTIVSGATAAPSGEFEACGTAPKMPLLRLDTVKHFNASIDQFKSYQGAARTYDTCVMKRARTAEEAVSADARKRIKAIHDQGMAIHGRISESFSKIAAEFNQASAKLKKSGQR